MDEKHKPVTIAGGDHLPHIAWRAGHRSELDPRVLSVVEGESTTMDAIVRRLR